MKMGIWMGTVRPATSARKRVVGEVRQIAGSPQGRNASRMKHVHSW